MFIRIVAEVDGERIDVYNVLRKGPNLDVTEEIAEALWSAAWDRKLADEASDWVEG